jgi:hypothetical protein
MMVDEQALWRLVHRIAAQQALSERQICKLRSWAADQARERRFRVFSDQSPDLRPSFAHAVNHAASELLAGRTPE